MKNRGWCKVTTTMGPLGYLPGSGTIATIVTLPLVWLLATYCSPLGYTLSMIGAMVVGFALITSALSWFEGCADPREIIFDEVVGCLVTFWHIPLSLDAVLAGVVLFRVLDIIKPGPIRLVEQLPGAWGILMDDVLAGVIANILLRILVFYAFL